jgi:hypothetical protein
VPWDGDQGGSGLDAHPVKTAHTNAMVESANPGCFRIRPVGEKPAALAAEKHVGGTIFISSVGLPDANPRAVCQCSLIAMDITVVHGIGRVSQRLNPLGLAVRRDIAVAKGVVPIRGNA